MALWIFSGCAGGNDDSNGGFTTVPVTTMNSSATMADTGVDTSAGTTAEPTTSGATVTSDGSTTSVDPTTGAGASSSSSTTGVEATTSADASSSGTTAPPPGCGNGVLDPLEECDDGNVVYMVQFGACCSNSIIYVS